MPGRSTPLVTDEIYHVYNRGIHRQPTFTTKREYGRAIECMQYYRFANPPVRLSRFLKLENERKLQIIDAINRINPQISIYAYCLMPNHYHILLKQNNDKGISKFISNFQNSYTKYFNSKHDIDGSLFLNSFKAARIVSDNQLIHVCRYIHLNPYTSYVIKSVADLRDYPWSSLRDYISGNNQFVDTNLILGKYKNIKEFEQSLYDQADYQRKLKEITHLILDN